MIREVKDYLLKHPSIFVLLIISWMVNISLIFPLNIRFGHDTFWHLSLINVAFQTFPPELPIFAGETLKGYNYLLDLIMYAITIPGISATISYFVILPIIYLIATTFFGLVFAIRYDKSAFFVGSFLFFIFLASPFSYVLSFIKQGFLFYGYHYPTTIQSVTALTNSAYAFTIPLFLIAMIILLKKQVSQKGIIALGFLLFVAFGVKFYGGVSLAFFVSISLFLYYFKHKNIAFLLKSAAVIGFFSAMAIIIFYDPFSSVQSGAIFGFDPLATVYPIIENPGLFYIPYLV